MEQRNRINNNKRAIFDSVKAAQYSGSSNPPYVMAVNEFRRITRDIRVLAMNELSAIKAARGEPPVNLGDIGDLQSIISIARRKRKER
jgi:predicted metal-binding protein